MWLGSSDAAEGVVNLKNHDRLAFSLGVLPPLLATAAPWPCQGPAPCRIACHREHAWSNSIGPFQGGLSLLVFGASCVVCLVEGHA